MFPPLFALMMINVDVVTIFNVLCHLQSHVKMELKRKCEMECKWKVKMEGKRKVTLVANDGLGLNLRPWA